MPQVLFLQITLALCAVEMVHAQCIHGDIRLTGLTFYYGQVEFCSNGVWERVCNDDFNQVEYNVVCRQLKLSGLALDLSGI